MEILPFRVVRLFPPFPRSRYLDLVSLLLKHNPDVRKQSAEGKDGGGGGPER